MDRLDQSIKEQREHPLQEIKELIARSIRAASDINEFHGEWMEQLVALGDKLLIEPEAGLRLRQDHRMLEQDPSKMTEWIHSLASISSLLEEQAPLYPLLVLLSLVPEKNDPSFRSKEEEQAVLAVFRDLYIWADDYNKRTGQYGFSEIGWFRNHLSRNLLQLGRLQFQTGATFNQGIRVYVNKDNPQQQIALAEDGKFFCAEGWLVKADQAAAVNAWQASLVHKENWVIGHPVQQSGAVSREQVSLDLHARELALQEGDPVLNVHIPADGPLLEEDCRHSFQRAATYFATHYPEISWKGCVCVSWLMDHQLAIILPKDANIARFLGLFHLSPITGTGRSGYARIFGTAEPDPEVVPQDTSLRRAVVSFLRSGGDLKLGGGYLLWQECASMSD